MLIALYGDSRAGKDTVAKEIVEYTKGRYEWRSFAVVLRELLYRINPLIGPEMRYASSIDAYGLDKTKKFYPESVDLMISLGQGARDILGEDVWVNPVMSDIDNNGLEDVVISDCRQPNEYDAIIERGGEVWKVVRPGTTRRGMDGLLDDRLFHTVIYNDSSINILKQIVREVLDVG